MVFHGPHLFPWAQVPRELGGGSRSGVPGHGGPPLGVGALPRGAPVAPSFGPSGPHDHPAFPWLKWTQMGAAVPPRRMGGCRWAQRGVPRGQWEPEGTRLQRLAVGGRCLRSASCSQAVWLRTIRHLLGSEQSGAGRAGDWLWGFRAPSWPRARQPGGQPCPPPKLGSWPVRRAGTAAGPPWQGSGPACGGPQAGTSFRSRRGEWEVSGLTLQFPLEKQPRFERWFQAFKKLQIYPVS